MAKKIKMRWERVIPLAVLVFLVLYLLVSLVASLFRKPEPEINIYTLCNLNGKQTLKLLEDEDRENKVLVRDYHFYGESLNLYYQNFAVNMDYADTLADETVVLKDMCSDKEYTFAVTSQVDMQIELGQLEPGFYSVYVLNKGVYKRVYMERGLFTNNIIYTVPRNGVKTCVELVANQTLFDQENAETSVLDQPYLYIKVTKAEIQTTTTTITDYETGEEKEVTTIDGDYDVIIYTSPARTLAMEATAGETRNGIVEADEMWAVGQEIVDKLTEKGFKVLMLKSSARDSVYYYEEGGLLEKAYKSKAKYMIYLDMNNLAYEVRMTHSGYASDALTKAIWLKLVDIGLYSGYESDEVHASPLTKGLLDASRKYDSDYEIREAGGRALAAGGYSEASSSNASFASSNYYGINTVKICTTNIYNASSVSTWKKVRSKVAGAVVEGFLDYINAKPAAEEQNQETPAQE